MKIALLVVDNRDEFRKYEAPEPWFGTAPSALLQGFSEHPDCEVHVVCCTQRPLRSPERLASNIYYHSVLVPKLGWMRSGYSGCILAVRKLLRQIGPDIVHGQGTERFCAMSAVFSGFPNVLTIHGNMRQIARSNHARPFSFAWLSARLEGFVLPRTDGVVCITTYTKRSVESLAKKTWVVCNAVDRDFFKTQRDPVKPRQVVCVADILHHKNQIRLLEALDSLPGKDGVRFLFLGRAMPQDPYAQKFLEMLPTRPWCRHLGFVDQKQIKGVLAETSLLVLPSLEDNCPMAILEAMAAGVPVVAAKVGGVPDLVQDHVTGRLFDPTDTGSISETVGSMLDDERGAEAMAQNAKKAAVERFCPQSVAAAHLAIYREVLEKHQFGCCK